MVALSRGLLLLLWVVFIQLAGIYLFTGGFLLTRLSLSESNSCTSKPCTLESTHTRAIVLIIDALRFDFLSPNPPEPASPFHHNILTLPRRLTAQFPRNSFLFDSYADPPTATLQRIKGLTTGSLPTFVDMGNNFGASSIAEDSIIKQLQAAGKKIAFMGDDTWMSVFPDSFHPNMTFPFDSFNVEDLHTVDEGVITNLFPLLRDKSKPFDFLIGHFLGVDHVGHRVGPEHTSMKDKLDQMNKVLERVVELLDDDTLLVLLGDHGMDRTGDHGGDGDLETSAALWVYSKGRELRSSVASNIPSSLLEYTVFPRSTTAHRRIQQIDIVPTLSLLLGLPIPFNNLGTVIPELFERDNDLSLALKVNAEQIKSYLDAYRASPSGGELDESWSLLEDAWKKSDVLGDDQFLKIYEFNRQALSICRALWAQFNPLRMGMGLSLLGVGLLVMWSIFSGISASKSLDGASSKLPLGFYGIIAGSILGPIIHLIAKPYNTDIGLVDYILFSTALGSCIPPLITLFPSSTLLTWATLRAFPVLLILHSISFSSNSFTFWEDRIVPFLLVTSITPSVIKGFTAPTSRLRSRILGFSLLFAICVRLMAISTVCREEQQPYCHVTYYASSSLPSPPLLIRILALPTAFAIPLAMQRILHISRSDAGIAKLFLLTLLRLALMAASVSWLLEWVDSARVMDGWSISETAWSKGLRTTRSMLGGMTFAGIAILGTGLWWLVPMCLDITDESQVADPAGERVGSGSTSVPKKRQIKVIGFGNAFGSPYLLFWSIPFCLVYATTQLTGQITLGLGVIALLAYLEVVDSVRDVRTLEEAFNSATPSALLKDLGVFDRASQPMFGRPSPQVRFSEIVPVALLGIQIFYATGHQATISSIQWKSAFVLTKGVTYPFSVVTVILNSFGPLMLAGFAAPLLAMWNRSPLGPSATGAPPQSKSKAETSQSDAVDLQPDAQIRRESILAGLGMIIYHGCLLLGTAVSAAILRRHLMVWKVFAPRFMLGICEVLAVDFGVLVGVGVGVERIARKVGGMFGSVAPKTAKR